MGRWGGEDGEPSYEGQDLGMVRIFLFVEHPILCTTRKICCCLNLHTLIMICWLL